MLYSDTDDFWYEIETNDLYQDLVGNTSLKHFNFFYYKKDNSRLDNT